MMQFLLHVTCSCIPMHTYSIFNILDIFELFGTFFIVFFFPLFLSCLRQSCLWHQNINMLHPRTLCILGPPLLLILLLLISNSMMRMPERTSWRIFLDEVFIQNAESFCRISPTLTYPLSFTVGVRSHCVRTVSITTQGKALATYALYLKRTGHNWGSLQLLINPSSTQ